MEYKTALNKCMQICSRAEHCSFDIQKKMQQWFVEESDQEKILTYLYKENFLNNERYINSFVRDKFRFNGWGKVKIKYMLKQKHLQGELVDKALNSIDNDEYLNKLREELIKKISLTKGRNDFDKKTKVIRYLASRGFEQDHLFSMYEQYK